MRRSARHSFPEVSLQKVVQLNHDNIERHQSNNSEIGTTLMSVGSGVP